MVVAPIFAASRAAELRRLDAHFASVLGELRGAPAMRIGGVARRARERHLAELHTYAERRRFPKNRRYPGQKLPHFVDAAGTRCAMAHLLERSGERDLVAHVARTRNLATIHDLAGMPELVAWLEANGLTLEEAARIQPTYCSPASECACTDIVPTLVEGIFVATPAPHVQVIAVHGEDIGVGAGEELLATVEFDAVRDGDTCLAFSNGRQTHVIWSIDARGDVDVEATCPSSRQTPPGLLPKQVLVDAILTGSGQSCEAFVEAFDPAWAQLPPGCRTEPTTSSSTSTGAGGAVSSSSVGGSMGGGGGGGTTATSGQGAGDETMQPPMVAESSCQIRRAMGGEGALVLVATTAALLAMRIRRRAL